MSEAKCSGVAGCLASSHQSPGMQQLLHILGQLHSLQGSVAARSEPCPHQPLGNMCLPPQVAGGARGRKGHFQPRCIMCWQPAQHTASAGGVSKVQDAQLTRSCAQVRMQAASNRRSTTTRLQAAAALATPAAPPARTGRSWPTRASCTGSTEGAHPCSPAPCTQLLWNLAPKPGGTHCGPSACLACTRLQSHMTLLPL